MTEEVEDILWPIPRGDSDHLLIRRRSLTGDILDFTGWDIELFDVHEDLEGKLSTSWEEAETGLVRIQVSSLKTLKLRTSHSFRVALIPPGGDRTRDLTFPLIRLVAM